MTELELIQLYLQNRDRYRAEVLDFKHNYVEKDNMKLPTIQYVIDNDRTGTATLHFDTARELFTHVTKDFSHSPTPKSPHPDFHVQMLIRIPEGQG